MKIEFLYSKSDNVPIYPHQIYQIVPILTHMISWLRPLKERCPMRWEAKTKKMNAYFLDEDNNLYLQLWRKKWNFPEHLLKKSGHLTSQQTFLIIRELATCWICLILTISAPFILGKLCKSVILCTTIFIYQVPQSLFEMEILMKIFSVEFDLLASSTCPT